MRLLEGKVAFITGAANGLGLEIAKSLAREGAKVVIGDIDKQKIKDVSILSNEDLSITGIKCDVCNEKELQASIEYTVDTFDKIDILINNAGLQHVSSIEEFPVERFEYLLKVMLLAPFIAIKHVFPIMKKQNYGRIINISSVNGLIGFAGKAGYNSAKHGVIGLTKVAALEGAEHGITVNAICPGYVDSPLLRNQLKELSITRNISEEKVIEDVLYPLIPQKRLLEAEEIAEYTKFLVSDKARGITGQAAVIDGGYTVQ